MAKRKQGKRRYKTRYKSLKNTWIGILVLILITGYTIYQDNKEIEKGERFEVTLVKVVDGDTAWFDIDGQETKVRFLYIDTPESTTTIEPYGKEASEFVSNELNNAEKIELELNVDGDEYDKYDRLLAWIFVDNELLQEKIAKNGLCEKFYDYGYEYTYKNIIVEADKEAKAKKLGIYSE